MKWIVMDMDGTLLTSDKKISQRTKDKLIELERAGNCLALASGRPFKGMIEYAKELEMDKYEGLLISSNGARVQSMDGTIICESPLDINVAKQILKHLESFDVQPMIEHGDEMIIDASKQKLISVAGKPFDVLNYEIAGNGFQKKAVTNLADEVDFAPAKILTAGSDFYLQENWQKMAEPFATNTSSMFTGPFYYEFTAKGVDKGTALAQLEKLGYMNKADVIGFGDAPNDIPLFKGAGLKVAMGNAHEDTKKAADLVTADNDHDGIARCLEDCFR